MEIDEIRQRIADLAKEKKMMEESLQEAMVAAIQEIAKENPHNIQKKSGFRMMTISSSQLLDKPWSFEFFDWEESAAVILDYLKKTPVINWKQKLTELLDTKGDVIELKKRGPRTPLDKAFIRKIVERI